MRIYLAYYYGNDAIFEKKSSFKAQFCVHRTKNVSVQIIWGHQNIKFIENINCCANRKKSKKNKAYLFFHWKPFYLTRKYLPGKKIICKTRYPYTDSMLYEHEIFFTFKANTAYQILYPATHNLLSKWTVLRHKSTTLRGTYDFTILTFTQTSYDSGYLGRSFWRISPF